MWEILTYSPCYSDSLDFLRGFLKKVLCKLCQLVLIIGFSHFLGKVNYYWRFLTTFFTRNIPSEEGLYKKNQNIAH